MKTTSIYNISFICKANSNNPKSSFDIYWSKKMYNHHECIACVEKKKNEIVGEGRVDWCDTIMIIMV
jgi:hypothetical protein